MQRSTSRTLWIALGIFAVFALVASSWGGGMFLGGYGYRPFVAPWLFGFWGIGILARLLFFGLVMFLVLRLFSGRRGSWDGPLYSDSPAEILRRRYAAGEITREQYEEMRHTLEPAA